MNKNIKRIRIQIGTVTRLPEFSEKALANGWMTAEQADPIEVEAKETIQIALAFAEASPLPD